MEFCPPAIVYLLISLAINCESKKYMRCELCRELVQKYKFDKTFMSNWVCMIEHESDRDTSAVKRKPNGSVNYGIFQISNREWCREGRRGGICNIKCEDLINDDISDDVACVKKVYQRDGFKHWSGWSQTCRDPTNLVNLNVNCRLLDLR